MCSLEGFEFTYDHSFQPRRAFIGEGDGRSAKTLNVYSNFSLSKTGNCSMADPRNSPNLDQHLSLSLVELIDKSVAKSEARAHDGPSGVCEQQKLHHRVLDDGVHQLVGEGHGWGQSLVHRVAGVQCSWSLESAWKPGLWRTRTTPRLRLRMASLSLAGSLSWEIFSTWTIGKAAARSPYRKCTSSQVSWLAWTPIITVLPPSLNNCFLTSRETTLINHIQNIFKFMVLRI